MRNATLCALQLVLLCLIGPDYAKAKGFSSPGDSSGATPYEKRGDAIIVHLDHPRPFYPRTLSLEAITPRIIHITGFPTEDVQVPYSLMRVNNPAPAPRYEALQKGNELLFSTDSLVVHVSLSTGKISIADHQGKLLFSEADRDEAPFSTDTAEGEHAWKVSSTFVSPQGESLYGLGQQQNGLMDYKGRSLTLLQQNSSVAIPFVLSSRNYGLLWDNYSITRFGDLHGYQPLSSADPRGENGEAGLTATYGNGTTDNASTIFTARPETTIDYPFLPDLTKLPKGYSLQNGWVRWKGTLGSASDGVYQFLLYYGGYVKVWVDGKLVADRWRQCWNPGTALFDVPFQKGKRVPVTVEWKPDGSESYISLKCLPPATVAYKNTYSFSSEVGDAINYYFIKGNDLDEVISGYRVLTGKAPLMPIWAMGLWQSRERYKTQDELLGTVRTFRDKHIPLDNIVLDWQYWRPDQWGSHEFDPSRFPQPQAMLDNLHDSLHAHFMISVWPKFYTGTRNFDLFKEKGWLYTRSVDIGQKDWLGYVSTFYDAFNPEARQMFWKLMDQKLFSLGVDGWWMDATEPDILSNTSIEERKQLMMPHAVGTPSRYFNAFPLENARAVYEGQRASAEGASRRVFILTRSAYAGQQRYASATWSGDIGARWHDLRSQITAGLNFSLSGMPYWTMDIGGFAVEHRYEHPGAADLDEWRELNARWFQFGTFCPLLRVHGQFPYREVFNIAPQDHPAYKSIVYYDKLRYRLLPYIYSTAARVWYDNYTLMRALVLDFEADKTAREIGDEYMFGPSILVNPVYQYGARTRKVYLPAGADWYDAYSGTKLNGGQQIEAPAPFERLPLYVRSGSIIPVGPELQYTNEKPADTLTLFVYTGASGAFTLYEDEDTNYNYEKGAYATIPLHYDETARILTIGERKGSFPGMLASRAFRVIWISAGHPHGLAEEAVNGVAQKADATVRYNGNSLTLKAPL